MELLCALLTGFFLWLFLFHWHHAALARAREAAGALLIEVPAAGKVLQANRHKGIRSAANMLVVFLFITYFVFWQSVTRWTLFFDFIVAMFTYFTVWEAFPPYRKDASLELCERGVIRRKQSYENRPGCLTFTPWEEIAGCKWYKKLPDHYVHTRHLLLECGLLSRDESEAITAEAGRFVPVYDMEGEQIAGPAPADRASSAVARRQRSGGLRFQFNLQSLLLLMVLVSCAASCYGIYCRRIESQREVLAALDAFHPQVSRIGGNVWSLDFSTCSVKPGDDDLVHLKELPALESLDLDGSPISDAGLRHLYPIKTLQSVSLLGTNVTQEGVNELKRQSPDVQINYCPAKNPVVLKPADKK
jgi:hypothetical protein